MSRPYHPPHLTKNTAVPPQSPLAPNLQCTAVLNSTHVTAVPPSVYSLSIRCPKKHGRTPPFSSHATFAVYGRAKSHTCHAPTYHTKNTAVPPHSPLAPHLRGTAVLNPIHVTEEVHRSHYHAEAKHRKKRAGGSQTNVSRSGKTAPERVSLYNVNQTLC